MLTEAVALIAILVVALYVYLTWNYGYWRKQGIVEVEPVLPGVGNLLHAVLQKRSAFFIQNDVYKKFTGEQVVGFYHLRQPALIIRDPDVIQTVLVNSFSKFHDNVIQIDVKREPYAAIDPFFSMGPKWKENRALMSPAFTNSRVKTCFHKMQELNGQLNQYIDKHLDQDFYIINLSYLYTTDVVASSGYGVVSNTASGEENVFMKYGKILMQEGGLHGFKMFMLFFTPTLAKYLHMHFIPSKLNEFIQELVNTVTKHREKNNVAQNDFLQVIMNNREKALSEAKPNDKAAIGFGTSSMTINYTLYELAMNVDCQKKLRDELQEVTKNGKPLEYETLIKLPYLDCVVSESMRKYSIALSMMKTCTESTTLHIEGKPVHIKAGTHIVIPLNAIHSDPKWYPNPQKYDPERFSEENSRNRYHYTYLPFGEGPRICIGMRFALAQVKAFLANIVLNYNILKSNRTPEKLTYNQSALMLECNERLWIRLQKCQRHTG